MGKRVTGEPMRQLLNVEDYSARCYAALWRRRRNVPPHVGRANGLGRSRFEARRG